MELVENIELKKPLTFDEQVEKLKTHGLIIAHEDEAKKVLRKVNYYRFTGYALQFRQSKFNSDYVGGTTFERVYKLCVLDEMLRDVLRKYIEKVEVYYKTQIAYGFTFSKCNVPPYNQHYDATNFYNRLGYQEIVDSFAKERNYYKDSLIVKHHKKKYGGKMPLWVIMELMSFSNVSKLYSSMYFSEKDIIAQAVGTGRETLVNNLHCLSVLRNKCAHAARLYNTLFNPPAMFTKAFLRKYTEVKNDSLFAYVIVLAKRLPDTESKKVLISDIGNIVKQFDKRDISRIGFSENYLAILTKESNCD